MKRSYFPYLFLIFSLILTGLSACEEDDDDPTDEFPQLDRGDTEVERMVIRFSEMQGNTLVFADSAEVVDQDGPGGNPAQIIDSLEIDWFDNFNNLIEYRADIDFYLNGNLVDSIIENNYEDYIVCYRRYNTSELTLLDRNNDPDGNEFGMITEWETKGGPGNSSGVNTLFITLNYQPLRKENLCDAGIRIFETNLPYRLK